MRQARRGFRARSHDLVRCRGSRFLRELLALDDHLDVVFLHSPLLIVAPPHWSLVFAAKSEMFTSRARW